jgi:hypothetical protein
MLGENIIKYGTIVITERKIKLSQFFVMKVNTV